MNRISIDLSDNEFDIVTKSLASYSSAMSRKMEDAEKVENGLDKSALYKDEKEKADMLFTKMYRYATEKRQSFSTDTLRLIRALSCKECIKGIEEGDYVWASSCLDILNTAQSQLHCSRFKDLAALCLTPDGKWDDLEEREPTSEEFSTFGVLNSWVRSPDSEITPELEEKLEAYLSNHISKKVKTDKELVEERKLTLNRLVTLCTRFCSEQHMIKLYELAETIAKNIK